METDKIIQNSRLLSRALSETHLDEKLAFKLATAICTYAEKNTITDEDLRAIAFFEALRGSITADNVHHAAFAIINGIDNMEGTWNLLLEKGFTKDEVENYFKKCSDAFSLNSEKINAVYDYFVSVGLAKEEILQLLLKAAPLHTEAVKELSESVLKRYDKELLVNLGKGFLFHPYYTDPQEAIETVYNHYGPTLSRQLLENEEYFLYDYKEASHQKDLSMSHPDALAVIEKYKAML